MVAVPRYLQLEMVAIPETRLEPHTSLGQPLVLHHTEILHSPSADAELAVAPPPSKPYKVGETRPTRHAPSPKAKHALPDTHRALSHTRPTRHAPNPDPKMPSPTRLQLSRPHTRHASATVALAPPMIQRPIQWGPEHLS